MTALLIVAGYLLGWVLGTAVGARLLANNLGTCLEESYYGSVRCKAVHVSPGHWRGDGTVGPRELWVASVAGLAWPVLLFPAVAGLALWWAER